MYLRYEYDSVPKPRPPQMRQLPSLAVFDAVDVVALRGSSFMLHVFVLPLTEAAKDWFPPGVTPSADGKDTKGVFGVTGLWDEPGNALYSDNYAGSAGIFGGKGPKCTNCLQTKPVNVFVDITAALNRLRLTRHEVTVVTFIKDAAKPGACLKRLVASDPIPLPRITGPLFDCKHSSMRETNDNTDNAHLNAETTAAQRYVNAVGYAANVDGWFGPKTKGSVEKFQKFNGLSADGVVGPVTKSLMMRTRVDFRRDSSTDEALKWPYGNRKFDSSVTELVVNVGVVPGYLSRHATLKTIRSTFKQWEDAIGGALKITVLDGVGKVKVSGKHQHAISVLWSTVAVTEDVDVVFGLAGGCLAHADDDQIVMDSAERWLLPSSKPNPHALQFSLVPVVLHEMGHVLGLEHSKIASDVMSPYYIENQVTLSENDVERIEDLYSS